MREIVRWEAGELRGFLIFKMGKTGKDYQMEGKKCKHHKRLKHEEEDPCRSEGGDLAWGRQLCMLIAVKEHSLAAATKNSQGLREKQSRKTNEICESRRPGGD